MIVARVRKDGRMMQDLMEVEGAVDLHCDIYSDDWNAHDKPVVLVIHGGAWIVGSRNMGISFPLLHALVLHGWLCVSIDHRLCPEVDLFTQIVDCKRAVHWIHTHISEFGGDPDFVVVMGESAGGHLAVTLALTQNMEIYQPGCLLSRCLMLFFWVDLRMRTLL